MLLDKAQLAVFSHVATESGRYAIDMVAVEPDGTCVATDGRQLIAVPPNGAEDADWPEGIGTPVNPQKRTLFPAHVFADARKTLRKRPAKPVLHNAAVTAAGEYAELTTTDLTKVHKAGGLVAKDDVFPDWRSMIPDEREGEVRIAVDPHMLARALQTLGSMLSYENCAIHMRVAGPEEPIVLTAKLGPDREAVAVVAPVRVKG